MRVIRVHQFGGPEVLRLETVANPFALIGRDPVLGPEEVWVELKAIGVNPVETYLRSGSNPQLPLPYTPGSDGAGLVKGVGSAVHHLAVGERVYVAGSLTGTYAQETLCQRDQVYPLPDSIRFGQGAALFVPYATAYRALFQRGRGIPGERVLIHGASGGVGIAAIQWAKAAGLRIMGTAGSERGLELLKEQGCDGICNHRQPGYIEELRSWTQGEGYDLILEMLANLNLEGRVLVVGNRGRVEINPRQAMSQESSILGVMLYKASPKEMQSIHAAIGAGLRSGTLNPVTGRELDLADAAQAHQAVLESGAYGKILLIP
ncbi:MAG: NADPH:quinone reductase [Cyanobacteriota bacterium]